MKKTLEDYLEYFNQMGKRIFSKKASHFGIKLGIVMLVITAIAFGFYTSNDDAQEITGAVVGLEDITGFDTYKVTISTTGGNKEIAFNAKSSREAKKLAEEEGLKVVGTPRKISTPVITSDFEPVVIGGSPQRLITNGAETIPVPGGFEPDEFAEIQNSYRTWIKEERQGKDTPDNKKMFSEYPPTGMDSESIRKAFGISAPKAETGASTGSVTSVKLPNGKYLFRYEGKDYLSDRDEEPEELANIRKFKQNHPGARDSGFRTAGGEVIYSSKGKFVLQSTEAKQQYKGEAMKKIKIGGTEYEVVYDIEEGKSTPKEIKIGKSKKNIDPIILNQLQAIGGGENPLSLSGNNIIHVKETSKETGGEENKRVEKVIETRTFSSTNLIELEREESTVDQDNNIIELKLTTTTFKSVKGKDVRDKITETTYEKDVQGIIDQSKTRVLTINANGEPLSLQYYDNRDVTAEFELLKTQYKSRQYFAQFESILTDFSGLGYYATLFFEDEDLDAWREGVDEVFSTLYLGTEYWTSDICAASTDIDRSDEGVAYVDTRLGLASVAAHIEATRSQELITPPDEADERGIITTSREFLYKITFNVKNGDWEDDPTALEEMEFNVVLRGEREAQLFAEDIVLEKGDEFGQVGRNAIVQFSNFLYEQVCIEFDDAPNAWNLDDDELCNTIVGAPTTAESLGLASAGQQTQQENIGGNILDI